MIIGLGSDLIDIRRVERSIERFGDRFLLRIFTDIERAKSDRRAQRAASYAKRFAAKEACSKALGTGLSKGVFWRDMGVVNLPGGKPTMRLTGGALQRLREITPAGHDGRHRPDHHRRFPAGPGHRHHLGCGPIAAAGHETMINDAARLDPPVSIRFLLTGSETHARYERQDRSGRDSARVARK